MRPVSKAQAVACLLDAKHRRVLDVAEALHYVVCGQCSSSIQGDEPAERQWTALAEQVVAGARSARDICASMGVKL